MNLLNNLKKIMNSDPEAQRNQATNTYNYELRQRQMLSETLEKLK